MTKYVVRVAAGNDETDCRAVISLIFPANSTYEQVHEVLVAAVDQAEERWLSGPYEKTS